MKSSNRQNATDTVESTDPVFEQELRDTMRHSEQTLHPDIVARLATIRRQCVSNSQTGSAPSLPAGWFRIPATVLAFATLLLIITVWTPGLNNSTEQEYFDDAYTAVAHVDLYEDLEFYQWLAENEAVK